MKPSTPASFFLFGRWFGISNGSNLVVVKILCSSLFGKHTAARANQFIVSVRSVGCAQKRHQQESVRRSTDQECRREKTFGPTSQKNGGRRTDENNEKQHEENNPATQKCIQRRQWDFVVSTQKKNRNYKHYCDG